MAGRKEEKAERGEKTDITKDQKNTNTSHKLQDVMTELGTSVHSTFSSLLYATLKWVLLTLSGK